MSASSSKVGSVRTNRATAGWTKRAGSAGLRGGDETPTSPTAFNPKVGHCVPRRSLDATPAVDHGSWEGVMASDGFQHNSIFVISS